ncbi:hypothetical protein CKO20_05595 [Rhodocyclus tenuis]|nr:hypothetical protein [Rhodocyclus tenuis]
MRGEHRRSSKAEKPDMKDGNRRGGELALIHGWGIGSACWGAAAEALQSALGADWRIRQISLPGYDGNADDNAEGNADESFAACAAVLLATLPDGVVLCGWSLGGLLALQAAATSPQRVGGLILVGSTPCFTQRRDWNAAQAPAVLAAFHAALAGDAPATRKRFIALLNQGDTQARALTRALTTAQGDSAEPAPAALARGLDWLRDVDLRERVPHIDVPTLLIHGERDALTPPAAGRFLAATLPDAQFESFSDAAHAPFLADPQRFAARIAAFLAALPASGSAKVRGGELDSNEAADTASANPLANNAAALPPKQRVRAAFERAATSYDAAAVVQRQVADLLGAGLPPAGTGRAEEQSAAQADAQSAAQHRPTTASTTASGPLRAIDAGCGTGYGGAILRARWPDLELVAADFAPAMLAHPTHATGGALRLAADIEALPCADASFDLYWSSLAIQWCDSARVAREAARTLRPGGRLALATLGPNTFAELRTAFAGVDRYRHTLAFAPPRALAGHLRAAGFADIRIERQTLTLHYPELRELLAAVREIGANGVGAGARRGLMSRSVWQAFAAAYEEQRQPQGLPASYDVILAYASKPAASAS